jgi:hypothetical protein
MLAAILGFGGVVTDAQPTSAATTRPKVVIVVGPVGASTTSFKRSAEAVSRKARELGARVVEIYTPYATWDRVREAARGAKLLVYLGHGNGWPSPYSPFQPYTKNGMGLNSSSGNGNHNTKYRGEYYVKGGLDLAPGAVVLLMRTCYSAGNGEGAGPTGRLSTARARVDNYGAGFLRAGAKVVISEILGSADYVLRGLLKTDRTMREIFWSAPNATGRWSSTMGTPKRSPSWARGILDPYRPDWYFRSIVGDLDYRASSWRS